MRAPRVLCAFGCEKSSVSESRINEKKSQPHVKCLKKGSKMRESLPGLNVDNKQTMTVDHGQNNVRVSFSGEGIGLN